MGGGDFCEADKYHVHDMQRDREGPNVLLGEPPTNAMADEERQGCLPLMEWRDGTAVSLQVEPTNGRNPVVFVESVKTPSAHVLSASLEQFLMDWEAISYIEPRITALEPWLDPKSGHLRPDPDKAKAFRQLLLTASDRSVP